jgi:hypothetical protein
MTRPAKKRKVGNQYTVSIYNIPMEESNPVHIEKLECCGHVQKRMSNRLMSKVKDCSNKEFRAADGRKFKGIGGRNGLTQAGIKSIQGHYGAAIRNNPNNLEQMTADIWQIFYHRSGDHENCGEWCPAVNENDIEKANKHRFPEHVLQQIRPVFEALTNPELLTKCLHGGDQNANECFHNFIWERLPKSTFAGLKRLQIAVAEAVMVFNDGEIGRCMLNEYLGYSPGIYNITLCNRLNRLRMKESIRHGTLEAKETRKRQRMQKVTDLYLQEEKEGAVYQSSKF